MTRPPPASLHLFAAQPRCRPINDSAACHRARGAATALHRRAHETSRGHRFQPPVHTYRTLRAARDRCRYRCTAARGRALPIVCARHRKDDNLLACIRRRALVHSMLARFARSLACHHFIIARMRRRRIQKHFTIQHFVNSTPTDSLTQQPLFSARKVPSPAFPRMSNCRIFATLLSR